MDGRRPDPRDRAIGRAARDRGVAAALLVQDGHVGPGRRVAQELSRLLGAERTELDSGQHLCALRPLERDGQTLRHLTRPYGQGEENRCGRRPAQKGSNQLDGRRVGPVEVVQHEHERLRPGEFPEQRRTARWLR